MEDIKTRLHENPEEDLKKYRLRLLKNEGLALEHLEEICEGLEPIRGDYIWKVYKLDESCYVRITGGAGRNKEIIISNSPDLDGRTCVLPRTQDDRLTVDFGYVRSNDGSTLQKNGTYIRYIRTPDGLLNSVGCVVVDGRQLLFAGELTPDHGYSLMHRTDKDMYFDDSNMYSMYKSDHKGSSIDRPDAEKDTFLDHFMSKLEELQAEQGDISQYADVVKNDLQGLMSKTGIATIEPEHMSDEEIRIAQLTKTSKQQASRNSELESENASQRAKIQELEAQLEATQAKLDETTESLESERKLTKTLKEAIVRAFSTLVDRFSKKKLTGYKQAEVADAIKEAAVSIGMDMNKYEIDEKKPTMPEGH